MFFLNNNYLYSYYNMENMEKIEIFIQDLINNFNKFIGFKGFKGFKEGLDEKKYDFITVREPTIGVINQQTNQLETHKIEQGYTSVYLPIENKEDFNRIQLTNNLYIYNININNYELFKIAQKITVIEDGFFWLVLDKPLNNMVQSGSKVYVNESPPPRYEYLKLLNDLKDTKDQGLVYASKAKTFANNAETYASTGKTYITQAEEASSKANQYASTAGTYITQANDAAKKAEGYATNVLDTVTNVGNYSKQAKEFAKTAEANATNAGTYATNAQASSTNAETNARNSETNARKIETSSIKASAAATKAEAYSTEAGISSKQALDYATKADQANKNTQKDILSAQSLTSPAQNIDRTIEGFIDSSSRATEILNNPTKFSEFTELVRTHILARADNTKQARLLQASELLTQKDTIASNIIMDYLYKNEKGTNVNKVYDRITEQNDDKMRKIEINTYYNKAYQEYFNILKVIILVCIIIVPIIIANKNNLVPDIVTMFLIVAIIVVTMIFIFYKFSDIYMRDTADFDKMKIPYDRDAGALIKEGSIINKKNLLTSLTLTCIGEDCCDGSMVYDFAKNRCIATENFGNFFDKKINETFTTLVEPMSNNVFKKQYLVSNTLNCSSKDSFYSNECKNDIRFN